MADPALAGHHQDNRSETTGAAGISNRHGPTTARGTDPQRHCMVAFLMGLAPSGILSHGKSIISNI